MQPKSSDNNSVFIDKNTAPKIDGIMPYNYKKRRDELNKIVKNHIAKQQQLTQKNKSIVR